ncbi:MAG: restriction endonuclease [Flexibacter sp. CG_4_10_14_3_um_filter_32_15]|nr:MAG: restriction endonuclease [Flexibacter sp. CG_4_10_14_3_um_filter_32_15]
MLKEKIQIKVIETTKNKYGQYFTPKIIADFMIGLADINDDSKILEPSCGEGVFLKSLQKEGFEKNITAYEIDKDLIKDSVKELNDNFDVICESFISAKINQKFDLIIGNPPYIRWKNLEEELKQELAKSELWNTYFNSLCDYLYIFILKSIEVLEENGQLIFICPEYWLNTTHSLSLRNYMVKNGYFEAIYHFNETPIFDNATVSVIVFKYIKSKNKIPFIDIVKYHKNKKITAEIIEQIKTENSNEIEHFKVKQFEANKRWLLTDESEVLEIENFEKACQISSSNEVTSNDLFSNLPENQPKNKLENRLGKNIIYSTINDICDIGNGMVSGLDKAFQLDKKTDKEILNLLSEKEKQSTISVIKAKNLISFTYNEITPYIFLNEEKVKVEDENKLLTDYPNFYKKLKPLQDKLEKRYQYNRKINYWEWVFLRNYNLFNSDKPRIFVPCKERISNKNYFRFSFVEQGIFPTQDVTALFLKENVKENIFYVLAFLNNPRVFNWLKNKGIIKGNIVEFSEKPISSIPFRKIDWNNEKEIQLHNQIVELTKIFILERKQEILEEINQLFDVLLNHEINQTN